MIKYIVILGYSSILCFADRVSIDVDTYSTNIKFENSNVRKIADNIELIKLLELYSKSTTNAEILNLFVEESRLKLQAVLDDEVKGKMFKAAISTIETIKPFLGIFKNENEFMMISEMKLVGRGKFFQLAHVRKVGDRFLMVFKQNDFNSPESVLVDVLTRNPAYAEKLSIESDN